LEPFRHHVIVCTQQKEENETCCASAGSPSVLDAFRAEIGRAGLSDEVVVSSCGCFGLCESGPVAIVYPEGTWYAKLSAADVKEIVISHLGHGKPVMGLARNDYVRMREEILQHRKEYLAKMARKAAAGVAS
jgi:NADP-reducing hydrogenase subunit HndC